MEVFILSKEFYLKDKLVCKEYLKTCMDRRAAEDTIRGYLGSLCMRSGVNMQVCHPLPNLFIVKDYDNETGLVTRRFEYRIKGVEL